MSTSTATHHRRLLVIANETCTGAELFETLRERVDGADVAVEEKTPAEADDDEWRHPGYEYERGCRARHG